MNWTAAGAETGSIELTTADLVRHVRQVLRELSEVLGRNWRADDQLHTSALLLGNALDAYSAATGKPIPDLARRVLDHATLLDDLPEQPRRRAREILEREREWLIGHSQAVRAKYVPAVMRASAGRYDGEFLTSAAIEQVTRTVVQCWQGELSRRVGLAVLDPVCGSASLLLAAADAVGRVDVRLAGRDINHHSLAIAACTAFLSGRSIDLAAADILVQDSLADESFDLVVADIPFGMDWRRVEPEVRQEAADPAGRFGAGLPPRSDATFLFVQAMVARLRRADEGGGRALVFCPPAPLFNSASADVRRALSELDVVEAIIALPEGLNIRTDIRLYALVLNNAKAPSERNKCRLVDLRGMYEDSAVGPERRQLTANALREISRAFGTSASSAWTRTVTTDSFRYRNIRLEPAIDAGPGVGSTVLAAADIGPEEWLRRRYPVGRRPSMTVEPDIAVRWDIDSVFEHPQVRQVRSFLSASSWPSTRLSAVCETFAYIRSPSAPERSEVVQHLSGRERLMIPIEPHHDAVVGDPFDAVPNHRCAALTLAPSASPDFLAAWLNSDTGRSSRTAALKQAFPQLSTASTSPRSVDTSSAWRLLDEIVIPMPGHDLQVALSDSIRALEAGSRRLNELQDELWRSPADHLRIRRTAKRVAESGGLSEWAETLPYPLASALRTFEARRGDDAHGARQLLHFWEATAIFLATFLLSALRQDQSLWHSELPRLREAVHHSGLTFKRSTLGTWKNTVEFLARVFRTRLRSTDSDEIARTTRLLGNAPRPLLDRLLGSEILRLLSEVNELRNAWEGHGGTVSAAQARKQRELFQARTEELRDVIGFGWTEFPLIRAGFVDFDGVRHNTDAEVLQGPATPFRRDILAMSETLIRGGLYLTSPTEGSALRLVPLIRLAGAAGEADYTCYFYNRIERNEIRMVAYHLAAKNACTRPEPDVLALVRDLDGTPLAAAAGTARPTEE